MAPQAIDRCERLTSWHHREPTITELLSDSIIRAVMSADGVDPKMLERELRSMALTVQANALANGPESRKPVFRIAGCRTRKTAMPPTIE